MRTAKDNFWLDIPYTPGPSLSGEHEANVTIIGGGVTGMASAYFIKKRFPEKRVIVLESEYIGFGSSGRNSGMGSTIFAHNVVALKKSLGVEKTASLWKHSFQAISLLDELVKENGIDCDYEKNGLLVVAESEKEKWRLEKKVKAYEEIGAKMIWLDREQARSRIAGPDVRAAYYSPNDRTLNPAKLVRGMKGVAESLGVEVYEHSGCTRIEPGPVITVYTSQGSIRTDSIVMATNAYPNPLGLFRNKITSCFIYDIVTEPLSQAQMDELNWSGRENLMGSKNIFWAARFTADNRLLFTDDNPELYYDNDRDYSAVPMPFRRDYKMMIKKFPFLKGIKITHQWGGRIGITLNMMPAIGCTGKHGNIYYSMGYNGHGVAFSQLAGKTLAELMSGEKTELTDHYLINKRHWGIPSRPALYLGMYSYKLYLQGIDRWLAVGN
ncbi:MAG: FAD-binding oxidoreductase [Deltaproteobacteria bacterium]|nr:FAD-binding oxidoreductase [Deltaproteobacteria bacterium]